MADKSVSENGNTYAVDLTSPYVRLNKDILEEGHSTPAQQAAKMQLGSERNAFNRILGNAQDDYIEATGESIICGGISPISANGPLERGTDVIIGGDGTDNIFDDEIGDPRASVFDRQDNSPVTGGYLYFPEGKYGAKPAVELGDNSLLIGGKGKDTIYGGFGNDELWAGKYKSKEIDYSADVLYGGGDNDVLHSDGGGDLLFGGSGNDTLHGSPTRTAPFSIVTTNDSTSMYGGSGNDTLVSGKTNDYMVGDGSEGTLGNIPVNKQGSDTFVVGEGYDKVYGTTNSLPNPTALNVNEDNILKIGAGESPVAGAVKIKGFSSSANSGSTGFVAWGAPQATLDKLNSVTDQQQLEAAMQQFGIENVTVFTGITTCQVGKSNFMPPLGGEVKNFELPSH